MKAMAQLYFDCDSPCRKVFITTFRWSNMRMENPPCIGNFPITPGNLAYLLKMARKIVELPIRHGDVPNKHLSLPEGTILLWIGNFLATCDFQRVVPEGPPHHCQVAAVPCAHGILLRGSFASVSTGNLTNLMEEFWENHHFSGYIGYIN